MKKKVKALKIETFLAEVDSNIIMHASFEPPQLKSAHLIEPNKQYLVTLKPHITSLGRTTFTYVTIHLTHHFSINFRLPTTKIPRFIWKINNKAAKILFSQKK